MSKETHLNAFGYSHRNKGKWGGPKRAPVLQVVVRVAPGRTTWIVPLPSPARQPLPQGGHLQSCTMGRRGKPLPRAGWGGGSGTFKSTAQGGVGRGGRPRGSGRWWGSRKCPVSSESRRVQVGDRRTGSLGLQTPWSPEKKVLLELRAAFWFVLAVWVGS